MFFEEQSLVLIKSDLPISSFVDHVFIVVSKKSSSNPISTKFSPPFLLQVLEFWFCDKDEDPLGLMLCTCLGQSPSTNCPQDYAFPTDLP